MAGRRANILAAEANYAARDANVVGAATLWWTRAGFVAIIATLFATAWASLAAAAAARAANKSLDLFQQAEAGYLVPTVDLIDGGLAAHAALLNRGRTPVMVYHADLGLLTEAPVTAKPIDAFLTMTQFKADVLVSTDQPYQFGVLSLDSPARVVYLVGGAIYRDSSVEAE